MKIAVEETIDQLNIFHIIFDANGISPFQDPRACQARMVSLPKGDFAGFSFDRKGEKILTAFEREDKDVWRCFVLGEGFLTTASLDLSFLSDCLERISRDLGGILYFPYLDARSSLFSLFSSLDNTLSLKRLPSPIIHWEIEDCLFVENLKINSKRRAQRCWSKFESRLKLDVLKGEEAVAALDLIERKSWKYGAQQSMHQRSSQFAFYADWLRRGGLILHVALDQHIPVAYVLHAKIRHTLYALKYSYDAAYHAYSPGFYLLTQGCFSLGQKDEIETIDLWGSPDMLKNRIKSGEYDRYDFVWPSHAYGKRLLEERGSHDRRLERGMQQNQGLRTLYQVL
jgi:hypothetical protein